MEVRSLVLVLGFFLGAVVTVSGTSTAAAQCMVAGTSCDDGNYCTLSTTCDASLVCTGGSARSCNDSNACTLDVCNESANRCDNTSRPSGYACSDGEYCTTPDTCDGAGACTAGPPRSCDDGEVCTGPDTCDETGNRCRNDLLAGWCRIRGECVAEGTVDTGGTSLCEQCVPSISTNRYEQAPEGTTCGATVCSGGDLTPAPLCNPIGDCVPSAAVMCTSGSCATTTSCAACTVDTECGVGEYCGGTECVASLDAGSTCDRSRQCTGGNCNDGVCCNRACGGGCESCDPPDSPGLCTPYASGTDPEGSCGSILGCDGFGSCIDATDASVGEDSGTIDSSVGAEPGTDGSTGGNLAAHGSGCIACAVGAPGRGRDFAGLAFSLLFMLGLALRRRL